MTEYKEKLLLVIAEPRSTCDINFMSDDEDQVVQLCNKIQETKKLLGADVAIFSSTTPVSINDYSSDWNFGHVKGFWLNQSLIEGGHLEENGKLILEYENCFMGKCFYPEGFAILAKENGFGNYEIIKNNQPGKVVEKMNGYIKELLKTYSIVKIIQLNDFGYSEPIIDVEYLQKEYALSIDTFIPSKPFNPENSRICVYNNSYTVISSEISIGGIIDCFDRYINAYK